MSELFKDSIDDAKLLPEMHLDLRDLRPCVRDLVALSALPAVWKDYGPTRIAESAASALVPMLGADFVYVRSYRDQDDENIDVIKAAEGIKGDEVDAIAAALRISIRQGDSERSVTIANPAGRGRLRLAIAPIGSEGHGVVVAGAQAAQFPTETQRLLLATAASEIALGSQRWHGETEMRRFVALVERSSDFVAIAELGGTTRYVNPAGMDLVGLGSLQQVRTKHVLEFLAPADRPRARDVAWPIVMQSGRWVGELTFRHFTSGDDIPFMVDWFRIDDSRNGSVLNIAAVCRDLRAQRKYELDLRHLHETLESKVAQRTAELTDANRQLVARMQQYERLDARLREAHLELGHASRLSTAGQMAAALAHELNQPVTAIANSLGAAKRLLARGTPGAIAFAGEVMNEALEQSLRAGQVVSQLRNFLIRGDMEVRVENVAAMIEEASALALIGSKVAAVQVRVLLDPAAPLIVANRIEIQQVLINLMLNALDAMKGMDRRLLSLTTTFKRPDMVEFAVADSGAGIDLEICDRIFEPFVTTKRNGMGIGLAVSHSIIERHGGRLRFDPNPDGGTIFSFTLAAVPSEGGLDAG
jgi:PAS domain S-box-containing protein